MSGLFGVMKPVHVRRGPTLNEQSGHVRSTLLRRVLAEKKTKQREDAASVEQGEGVRTGRDLLGLGQALRLEASPTTPANHRTLRCEHSQDGLRAGRMQDPTLTLQASSCCPTCGRVRILPAAPAAPAAASVSHLTTNFLHELLDLTTATLWPHFRAQDYAASCNRSWVYPLEEKSKEQLELKSLVLQELQKEVANISETYSPDALVMCILYLARIPPAALEGRAGHRATLWRDPEPARVCASLALCLSDLMSAMQNLTKPIYPIVGVDAKPLDLQPPSLLFHRLCNQNVSQPVILWCVAVAMSMLNMPDKTASAPSTLVPYMALLSQNAGVDSLDKLMALLESFAWVDAAVQYTEIVCGYQARLHETGR
ncbi:predicted protein [Aspergillus nidulans FGSC A4]|uniref:Uncharacterized protein n=1 Tax=Emericella nidulans (strain FGSC A4 / ATCC 38163 / CBS 112.46 / NRRL 194 / M139) TaxID=227321 RepID=Q5AWX7_EMENI|nr:hypothetical protein [Aspergillus nidulans FGSC A4]EAA61455.1 predicted protein [Aspergillus nidulans FGSC A4]CBF78873.1 TPA: conserved hypothetical protein [Aspergillus nidulans FGSC A4]|eukprot:XP_664807.1 predicted protein [Aspergillus nidulans FGSC A4]